MAWRTDFLSLDSAKTGSRYKILGMKPLQTSRGEILLRVRERILHYGTSKVGRDAAEDLAQETLMLLDQKYGHLESPEDLVPLAIRIMQLKLRALARSRRTD